MSRARFSATAVCAVGVWLLLGLSLPLRAMERRNVRFERITPADGLSQAFVHSTTQDRRGFIWFGTQEGLNRYDGYEFKVYAHDPQDPRSLPRSTVKSITEDHRGDLWIGTLGGGLSRFDPLSETFAHFRHDPNVPDSLNSDRVQVVIQDREHRLWVGTDGAGLSMSASLGRSFRPIPLPTDEAVSVRALFEDSEGYLWIGTERSGLFRYEPASGKSRQFLHDPARPTSLSENRVLSILEDRNGDLWIGTSRAGVNRFDRQRGEFERFRHGPGDDTLPSDSVRTIFEDRQGTLWFGTDTGLAEWLPAQRGFASYEHEENDPFTLSHGSVISIAEDRGGVLWVGTFSGLNKWNRATEVFRHYRHSSTDPTQLPHNFVTSFATAPGGETFVGTYGGGVSRLDPRTGTFHPLSSSPENRPADDRITSLDTDRSGVLWIGSRGGGVDRFDPATGQLTSYPAQPDNPHGLSAAGVTAVLEDTTGRLWVATYRGGLNQLDRRTGRFKHYRRDPDDPTSLSSDRVVALLEDSMGRIWVGTTGGGLNLYEPEIDGFYAYRYLHGSPRSLLSDDVMAIAEDSEGNLWIGTRGGGLNAWPAEQRRSLNPVFRHYTRNNGLLSNVVYAIVFDDRDRLWLSSNRGLTRFDPASGTFVHFDESNGLQSHEFNHQAAHRAPNGELFFGGINGFNSFRPDGLEHADYHAPIVLTEARIAGEQVRSPLSRSMIEAVEIDYRDRFFEFQFAALDFAAPKKTRYRYRLEGLESFWIDLRSRRRIAYANLAPGSYTLRVGATSYDGSWNPNELAVVLDVLPAPWATHWAKALYTLAVGAILLLIVRASRARLERARELAAATKAKEIAEYASRSKSQFLANMSHEIRTPLSGVLGMLELLMQSGLARNQRRFAATAGRSAQHLLNLLNDLLDLSKIEAGRLSLEVVEFDLRQTVEEVIDLFAENAHQRELDLFHEIPEGTPTAFRGDPTRLRQVLGNLVGNAVKFTDHGHVLVSCSAHPAQAGAAELLFTVEDTGIGMAQETRERVFDSFQQADGSTTRKYGGTGLGLTISKQLVEMMGGEIWVESVPGIGSRFRFSVSLELQDGAETAPAAPSFSATTALIAHSSAIGAGILEDTLQDWGIVTRRLQSLAAAGVPEPLDEEADLALIDVELIDAEGLDLTEVLGSIPPQTRVGVLLPLDFKHEQEAREAGADACLRKPLRRSELLRFIETEDSVDLSFDDSQAGLDLAVSKFRTNSPHVLIVEDNPTNQTVVVAMLDSLGVRADVVDDGLSAVEASSRESYDLILMDCQMPKMDGYEASRTIRDRERSHAELEGRATPERILPIVAMTASAMAGDRERCSAAGMDGYLSKPFDREQLLITLKRHLGAIWEAPSTSDVHSTQASVWDQADDATDENEVSSLDPRPLEVIRSLSPEKGDELVRTVIRSFLEDTPRILQEMKEGAEQEDASTLKNAAHRLKSSSANLGAMALSDYCRRLEAAAQAQDLSEAPDLVNNIDTAFVQARRALKARKERAA